MKSLLLVFALLLTAYLAVCWYLARHRRRRPHHLVPTWRRGSDDRRPAVVCGRCRRVIAGGPTPYRIGLCPLCYGELQGWHRLSRRPATAAEREALASANLIPED